MTNRYCLCGASLQAQSTPALAAESVAALFDAWHSGEGHGPTTAATAGRIRRRNEAAALKATAGR